MPNRTDMIGTVEVRDVAEGPSRLEGLAVPYGVTVNTALGRERFAMGAFADEVRSVERGARLAYLTRHGEDGGQIAAVIDHLHEASDGLHFGAALMGNGPATEVRDVVAAGIRGVSVEFVPGVVGRVPPDIREHRSGVRLAAIAGSYAPAYLDSRVSLRSAAHAAGRGTFEMPNLSVDALTQRRDAIDAEITTVRSLSEAESRALTVEERDSITALEGRRGNVDALLTTATAEAQRRDAERSALPGTTAAPSNSTGAHPGIVTRSETVYGPDSGVSYFGDLVAMAERRDQSAAERILRHRMLVTDLAGAINRGVESNEIAGAFPTQYYPDLYVPDMTYTGPLAAFFASTPISSPNPIIVPTFATQTGDTAIQATESTALANVDVTTTPKTVTPTTIGGETIVSRQAVDGASPGADVIIGNQLREILMRDREREIALVLEAITSSGAIADTAGTAAAQSGRDLVRGIQTICAQFYTGAAAGGAGARFLPPEGWFANATDWGNLVAAEDINNGRPLMPYINPVNSNGQLMTAGFQKGILGGVPVEPAWAILAATNHIVARKNDAMQWKSAVLDVQLNERNGPVSVVFAIWQYFVFAVLQPKGVRRYTYTNV